MHTIPQEDDLFPEEMGEREGGIVVGGGTSM